MRILLKKLKYYKFKFTINFSICKLCLIFVNLKLFQLITVITEETVNYQLRIICFFLKGSDN